MYVARYLNVQNGYDKKQQRLYFGGTSPALAFSATILSQRIDEIVQHIVKKSDYCHPVVTILYHIVTILSTILPTSSIRFTYMLIYVVTILCNFHHIVEVNNMVDNIVTKR